MTHILLVEDDRTQALFTKRVLCKGGKYSLSTVGTGQDCLAMDLTSIDIVLLDYNLPDMSGAQILHELLKKKDLPVIMVTGENAWSIIKEAILNGASDYIVKIGDYHQTIPFAVDKSIEIHKLKQERKRMEENLRQRNLELEKAYVDLKNAQGQLVQSAKMVSIGQLAAGVAHEINTPIQYVGDNTQFLVESFNSLFELFPHYDKVLTAAKNGSVPPELTAAVETAVAQTDIEYLRTEIPRAIMQSLDGIGRIAEIVRAMKEFSHPGIEQKVATDINRAIESTVTVSRNEWKYVADVVTDFAPELPLVSCLPGSFNQVILNIIVNAAHAIADVVGDGSGGKGTITISTRRDGDWVEIRIRDTGTGIPEAVRPNMFNLFFTTKEIGKGTGQGLALAHSVVVTNHGGTIHFETAMGEGTTFIIRLPIQDAK